MYFGHRNYDPIRIKTPFSFFPLLLGTLPLEKAARLVKHIYKEDTFWPAFPVPSVALDEEVFDAEQMWRGPSWVNVNYLLVEGMSRSGFKAEARQLRRKTLDMLTRLPDFYEYYNPLTGQPGAKAAPIFGWSAALYIDLALQESANRAFDDQ